MAIKDDIRQRFAKGRSNLSQYEKTVLDRIAERAAISRNISSASSEDLTFGQRIADKVAAFGGSWTFIFIFAGLILGWVFLNVALLSSPPDPFPFILLNLLLSMVAAIQAPVIMMSQNRQASNDRLTMNHDYEVNLKAELEIMSLHDKIDDIRARQLQEHFDQIDARLQAIEAAVSRLTEPKRG